MKYILLTINLNHILSHQYDCPLSLYDMYLQHGNVGVGYSYLMFLAYKSISQKPPSFFHHFYEKNNYSVYQSSCDNGGDDTADTLQNGSNTKTSASEYNDSYTSENIVLREEHNHTDDYE